MTACRPLNNANISRYSSKQVHIHLYNETEDNGNTSATDASYGKLKFTVLSNVSNFFNYCISFYNVKKLYDVIHY